MAKMAKNWKETGPLQWILYRNSSKGGALKVNLQLEEGAGFSHRVGHRALFRSERSVLFRSFKERNVLFHSFFEFLATYETQRMFFRKERKRTQHSFAKNVKECENVLFFWKRTQNVPFFFQSIYIDI